MQKYLFLSLVLLLSSCGKAHDSSVASIPNALVQEGRPSPSPLSAMEQALIVANEVRRENQLPELTLDPRITAAAQAHASDMQRRNYFDHSSPEGESPFQRMEKAGVRFMAAAENIAMGVSDPRRAFAMWLNSPGHRRNLLNKNYRRQGIGFVGGYWVHDFAN